MGACGRGGERDGGGGVEGEESVLKPWGVYVVCLGKTNKNPLGF